MIKGQSLVEVLVALGIFALMTSAAVLTFWGGQSLSFDSVNAENAMDYAEEGITAVHNIRDRNWNELGDGDHGLVFLNNQWYFASSTADDRDLFIRRANVQTVDENTKNITVTISWQTDQRPQKVELREQLTNWKNVLSGGLSGDWSNPRVLAGIDIGAGNAGTDVKVRNKIVYMTAVASSVDKPDFYVIDATNSQNPAVLASINTGPGLNSVAISGNYAYVANNDPAVQLQIIDISQNNNPILVKSYSVPNLSNAKGLSIFVINNIIYLGTSRTNEGKEFHIIDASNPTSPVLLGSLEMDSDINGIYVKNNKAYLVTPLSAELTIVDVANPVAPAVLGSFDMPGDSEDGKSIYVVGTKAYVGRLRGGNHTNHHEIHILDVTNPAAVQNLGSLDTAYDINDLLVAADLLFTATADPNRELRIFNIANSANITPYASLNFSQMATGLDLENNILYIAVRSNDALKIVTSTQ